MTEANDNLSIIDIRKRDFYEMKEKNIINNLTKNAPAPTISEPNFDDNNNKSIGLVDYVNFSPKLNLEVNIIYIKKGNQFKCITTRDDSKAPCPWARKLFKETKRWNSLFWIPGE